MEYTDKKMRPAAACRYLGVSPRTLADWKARGLIPHYQLSSRLVIYQQSDLDAFLASRRINGIHSSE